MIEQLSVPTAHFFRPDLGTFERRLVQVIRGFPSGDAFTYLNGIADQAAGTAFGKDLASERELRWAFSISLLADIAAAGGRVERMDSCLRVAWPDWASDAGREGLRRALIRLRNESPPVSTAANPDLLPRSMTATSLLHVLAEGKFHLAEGTDEHPRGVTYHQIFQAARQYWSMPDRDREGRNRRFVLTVDHPFVDAGTPVGLLEASDGAPHEGLRDSLFGLTTDSFSGWLSARRSRKKDLETIEERLKQLRLGLLPVKGLSHPNPANVYRRWRVLEDRAAGRSKDDEDIFGRKRLTYLIRLVRAEEAVRALLDSREPADGDLYAMVRLLRDLCIPRLHLDISICGAHPPFANALGGKFVVAFFGDPRIRKICATPPGAILRKIFDVERLSEQLPTSGAVLLTTKGLYPGHSAQYERALVPGRSAPIKLRRVGATRGMTASLLSRRSYALASLLLDHNTSERVVSNVFGSGGSKRQRRIEAAVQHVGLTDGFVHPGIERPVYALNLASNVAEVALLNARPQWLIEPKTSVLQYAEDASRLWRSRWLPVAQRRLGKGDECLTGLQDWLLSRMAGDESC